MIYVIMYFIILFLLLTLAFSVTKNDKKKKEMDKLDEMTTQIYTTIPFDKDNADELLYNELRRINANLELMQDKQKYHFKRIIKSLETTEFCIALLVIFLIAIPLILTILSVVGAIQIFNGIF